MRFSVCGMPLDDWANCGYVDVLFTCVSVALALSGIGLHTLIFLHSFSFRNSAKNIFFRAHT